MTKSRDLGDLAQTVAVNLPTSLGTAGQSLVVNSGADGLEFGAASGGSMTVYNDLNGTDGTPSGYTYLTNASSPSNGDLAFVTANNTVYVRAASGWRKIATVQEAPSAVTGHSVSYPDIGQNATTDITLSTTDPEGFDVTWSYVVGGNGTLSGSNINNSNGDTLASIAVQTANSNSGGTNTITFRVTRQTTTIAGDFTITFTATDSQSTGTSDTGAISFEIAFVIADSHYTSLLMATDGSAGDNDTITYDTGSTTGNSFTSIASDHTAGTFSPYRHGGYSNYFDGSGDYLSVADHTSLDLSTGDFTIEFFAYPQTGIASFASPIGKRSQSGFSGGDWRIGFDTSTNKFGLASGSNNTDRSTPTVSLDEWSHVAFVRSSGTLYCYANGVLGDSLSWTEDLDNAASLLIGRNVGTSYDFKGYISDVRILKGTAQYSGSTYSVPTERLTAVTNTSLLTCHLPYISDGSSNGHSITVNGNTSTKAFGPYDHAEYDESVNGGSILIDAYNKLIQLDDSNSDFAFGTTETTIKLWYYPMDADATAAQWLIRKGTSSSVVGYWALGHYSSNRLRFLIKDNGGNSFNAYSSNNVITPNAWNYIEWYQPTSGNGSVKVNGTEVISTGTSSNYGSNTDTIRLPQTTQNPSSGLYYADFQFVKGDARESSVPTAPMSTDTNAKLHVTGQQGHVIDKSQGNHLKLNGTATSTSALTSGSTPPYIGAAWANTSAVSFDGNGDWITGPTSLLNFSTANASSDIATIEAWVYHTSRTSPTYAYHNQAILGKGDVYFNMGINGSGNINFYHYDGTARYLTSAGTVPLNTWTHVAATISSGTVTLYINGSADSNTGTWYGLPSAGQNTETTIGRASTNASSNYFNGYISDLRVREGKATVPASGGPSSPLKG